MKYIIAIIQPGKLDDVHATLLQAWCVRTDSYGSSRLWETKEQKRDLSRCGVCRQFPSKGKSRSGRANKVGGKKLLKRSRKLQALARLAMAKFSFDLSDALRIRTG